MDTEGLRRRLVWRGNDAYLNLVTIGFKRDSRALQELGMVKGWMLEMRGGWREVLFWLPADMASSPMAKKQGPEQTCICRYVNWV